MKLNKWEYFEPLKTNRWIIKLKGCDIQEYLFRRYKIFNDADKLMFSTEIYETVHHHINPKELFNIEEVLIEFLDPTGGVVNGFIFTPKGIQFEQLGDYGSDDFLNYKILMEIDKSTLKSIYEGKKEEKNG
jgi:hypothetical protein